MTALFKKIGKWVLRIIAAIIVLLLLIWLLLQTQWGKNFVKDRAVSYLKNKLETEVRIRSIKVNWFNSLQLQDVYIEDRQKRELAFIGNLETQYSLANILRNKLYISNIRIDDLRAAVLRNSNDSFFNYQFIIDAFAGTEKEPSTPSGKSKPFVLQLKDIALNKIQLVMDDRYGGQLYKLSAGFIKSRIRKFDMDKLHITANYFFTKDINTNISFVKTAITQAAEKEVVQKNSDAEPSTLQIIADTLHLGNTVFYYDDKVSNMKIDTKAADIAASGIQYSQQQMHVKATSFLLNKHSTVVAFSTTAASSEKDTIPDTAIVDEKPLTFSVNRVLIDSNRFAMDNLSATPLKNVKTIDFNHLNLQQLTLHADSVSYDGKNYMAVIREAGIIEKSGFQLKQLQTKALYQPTGVQLNNLLLQTNHMLLAGNMELHYASPEKITTHPGETYIMADVTQSSLVLNDLLYFSPELGANPNFKALLGKTFILNTTAKGTLKEMNIPSLALKQGDIKVLAAAKLYDVTDAQKFRADLTLQQLAGNRNALLALLPPNTLPDSILHYIPQTFNVSGTFNGAVGNFITDLKLNSSLGDVTVKGKTQNITDAKKAMYDLNIHANALQLGNLLKDTALNRFSGNISVKGRGFDPAIADMRYNAFIKEFDYNGYKYNQVQASGTLKKNIAYANINSADPNALLSSVTTIDLSTRKKINTHTVLESVNLQKLGFSKDTFTIASNVVADLTLKEDGKLDGNLFVTATDLKMTGDHIQLDSIQLVATDSANIQKILLNTPYADAALTGDYILENLAPAFETIANKYYKVNSTDTLFTRRVIAHLEMNVHTPSGLTPFVPGLTSVTPFMLTGTINTDSSLVLLNTRIDRIQYGDYIVDTFSIAALNNENPENINYDISFKNLNSPSFVIPGFNLAGHLEPGLIDGNIQLLDHKKEPRYQLPFDLNTQNAVPELHFNETLVINNKKWTATPDNVIYLDMKKLGGSRLSISNNGEKLSINAHATDPGGMPLAVNFDNFSVRNITDIAISKDTALADGIINGNVTVQSIENFFFTSDLTIDSLKLAGISSGTLAVKASQQTENLIDVNAALTGYDNDVKVTGSYNIAAGSPDLNIHINKLNLANATIVTKDMLDDLTGNLSGNLKVTGTAAAPVINGVLNIDTLKTTYKEYSAWVYLPAGQVSFDNGTITLNNFNLLDSSNNKASLTGTVYSKDFTDFDIKLRFRSNNYQALGHKKYPGQTIFGPARINANIGINGNLETLNLTGTVTLADKSEFTYVYLPEETIVKGEGLIEFFDPDKPDTIQLTLKAAEPPPSSMNIGMSLNVKVTPTSTITIMMDEMSGDHLRIKGDADLNVTQEAGGEMYLAGKYIIDDGGYKLSLLGVARKEFQIQKGSSITWAGDALKGMMDITAVYKIRTSAGELVEDVDPSSGIGRQKMDFEVYLELKDELLQPKVNFRLDMPEKERQLFQGAVYSRIKQINTIPAELNKQVIALLALNRFIADNPFSSLSGGGGSNLQTNLYNTAGQYLTKELSALLNNTIKVVDIDLGLDMRDTYTNGAAQRNTNLNVGISKKLASDRLSVYVGSSFALEGQSQDYSALSGIAGNIILEYLLTKDGRYRLKGYRTTENEAILQGNIIKTGVSFVMVFEFNRITQMFKPKRFYTIPN